MTAVPGFINIGGTRIRVDEIRSYEGNLRNGRMLGSTIRFRNGDQHIVSITVPEIDKLIKEGLA